MKCEHTSTLLRTGMLILAGLLCLNGNRALAQGAESDNILAAHAGINFLVRAALSECKPLVATNQTSSELTIERIELAADTSVFEVTDLLPLPMKLAAGQSISLGYLCFRPTAPNQEYSYTAKVTFSPKQRPDEGIISIHAKSFAETPVENIAPTAIGAKINFDPVTIKNGTLLSMVGKDQEFYRSFTFRNVSQETITVNSFDFQKHDGRFEFTSVEPGGSLPLDVAPGESFSVRINYHSFERTPALNKLLIYTDNSKDPATYDIRGLQLPLSQMDWNKRAESKGQ